MGVVLLGCPHDRQCEIAESLVIAVKQGQSAFHTLLPGGIGQALGDPVAVRFVGQLLAHLGEVVLPVGRRDMARVRVRGMRRRSRARGARLAAG